MSKTICLTDLELVDAVQAIKAAAHREQEAIDGAMRAFQSEDRATMARIHQSSAEYHTEVLENLENILDKLQREEPDQ